ncbi:hypothetical protein [Thiosulfativibrio zosterae]|nr:hypothetical protein [Thiosulfativibrio zosterae]
MAITPTSTPNINAPKTTPGTSPTSSSGLNQTTTSSAPAAANTIRLTQGQILTIFVTQNSQNQTTFSYEGKTFKANTPLPMTETGNLQVQVKATQPSLQLEILSSKPNSTSLSPQAQVLIQNALKALLPNQISLPQAFQILSQPSLLQLLPPSLQNQLQTILNQLLRPNANLKGETLKDSLQNSGLFLENNLKNKVPPTQDLKAKLLQLQEAANNAPLSESTSKLATLLGKAINKITIQQIQLLENPQTIYAEPPLHPDSKIKAIEIDVRKSPPESSLNFEVLLTLQLEEGEMITKLLLDKDETVSTFIWGENQYLETQIEENLSNLKQSFQDAGIKTSVITLAKAKPITTKNATKIALIDIHI